MSQRIPDIHLQQPAGESGIAPVSLDRDRILINTKVTRPQLPAGIIIRPRLLERLDQALGRRNTLISAPAGYSKSTLAVQWLGRFPFITCICLCLK